MLAWCTRMFVDCDSVHNAIDYKCTCASRHTNTSVRILLALTSMHSSRRENASAWFHAHVRVSFKKRTALWTAVDNRTTELKARSTTKLFGIGRARATYVGICGRACAGNHCMLSCRHAHELCSHRALVSVLDASLTTCTHRGMAMWSSKRHEPGFV